MMKDPATINVERKDKKIFKDLVNKHDVTQSKFFHIMIKIIRKFDPEIKEELK